MQKSNPILLVGIPRSGSTWTAKVLSQIPECTLLLEPDNEKVNPFAYVLKKDLHRFPYLRENVDHSQYYNLWKANFSHRRIPDRIINILHNHFMPDQWTLEFQVGEKCNYLHKTGFFRFENNYQNSENNKLKLNKKLYQVNHLAKYFFLKKTVGRIIIKSVHANLSLPWIDRIFNPQIVIIFRNPLNIISSYLKLKMPDSIRNIYEQKQLIQDHFADSIHQISSATTLVQQMAIQIGGIYKVLENQIKQHPQWIIIKHETLCENPVREFKKLYQLLNLPWSQKTENYINKSNKKGEGFTEFRIAKNEIEKWKRNLTIKQIEDIKEYIQLFNLNLY